MHPGRGSVRSVGLTAVATVGVIGIGAYLTLLGVLDDSAPTVADALVIAPGLVMVSLPVLVRTGRREGPGVASLLVAALVLKLGAALVMWWTFFHLYGGVADSAGYHADGATIAGQFRAGDFNVEVGQVVGIGFTKIVTGAIYTVTGSSIFTGFLVFSWFGFWGLFLFYRAFRLAVPDVDGRVYGYLVFLLPSLLAWTSTLGKDALMTLFIGASCYGVARILTRSTAGYATLVVGLAGAAMVRPHVALMLVIGAVAALLVRSRPTGTSRAGEAATKLVGLAAVALVGSVLLGRTAHFLGVSELNPTTATTLIQQSGDRTAIGGSTFSSGNPNSPGRLLAGTFTVLFRPFPWEADSPQALLTSLEGFALLSIALAVVPRAARSARTALRAPYLVFSLSYAVVFVYAFSSFANFGILARQRVMVTPLLLVVGVALLRQPAPVRAVRAEPPAGEPDGPGRERREGVG